MCSHLRDQHWTARYLVETVPPEPAAGLIALHCEAVTDLKITCSTFHCECGSQIEIRVIGEQNGP